MSTLKEHVPLILKNVRTKSKYFGILSFILLMLLVFANSYIVAHEFDSSLQWYSAGTLIGLWMMSVGLSMRAAVFATVALMPAVESGFFTLQDFSLSLSDIFMVFTLGLFLLKPQIHRRILYTRLIWVLLIVCVFSSIANSIFADVKGMLLRLFFSIIFTTIVISSPRTHLSKAVFHGMLFWPLSTLMTTAGNDMLIGLITFNKFEYGILIGSHVYVVMLLYLLPMLIFLRTPIIIIIIILAYIFGLALFSHSRSLVIGIGISVMFYMFIVKQYKYHLFKLIIGVLLMTTMILMVEYLDYFNFSTESGAKIESTEVRLIKMINSWNSFLEKPILGHGYGSSGKEGRIFIDSRNDVVKESYNLRMNPEFTPFQIFVETGLIGALVVLLMLIISYRKGFSILKSDRAALYLKILWLCANTTFITGFLGGNKFSEIVFWLAIPVIFERLLSSFGVVEKPVYR